MKTSRKLKYGIAAASFAGFAAAIPGRLDAQQTASQAVQIGDSDLGGVVTSPTGPEAGVWVIAETADLPTKFAKIVATDERGRYLIPNLPKGQYTVWVSRLRPCRFGEGADRTRQERRPKGHTGPEPCRCRGILSGGLLVFAARNSGQEPVSRHRHAMGCRSS